MKKKSFFYFLHCVCLIALFFLSVHSLSADEGNDESTVFLFHMDGDRSIRNHPVLFNGSPSLDAVNTKWNGSLALDGFGDYVSIPNHVSWDFSSGNFTIDLWVLFRDLRDGQDIIGQREDGDKQWRLRKETDETLVFYWMYNGVRQVSLVSAPIVWQKGEWYHVALVRNNEQFMLFLNGKSVAEATYEGELLKPNDRLKIGSFGTGVSATSFLKGNIDELRISKGVARWTEDFSNDVPSVPYSDDEDTVLLIHFDGDQAMGANEPHTVNIKKTTEVTLQSVWNGAYYFDGNGNFVEVKDSDDWCFEEQDFTVDFWVRLDKAVEAQTALIAQWHHADKIQRAWVVYVNTNNTLACCSADTNNFYYGNFSTDIVLKPDQWYHIAFVRDGMYHKLFVDGKFGGMVDVSGKKMKNARQPLEIGRKMNLTTQFMGHIDEVRITKGVAVWKDDFSSKIRKAPYGETMPIISTDSEES
jgi:hypothetical protein